MNRWLFPVLLMMAAFLIGGCGSGGAGSTKKVVAKLKTAGMLASGQKIAGIDVTLSLPKGVTVATDPSGAVAATAVAMGGAANPATTLLTAKYTPATDTAAGSLRIIAVDAAGFTTGEFVEINCDITVGFFPVASDFFLTDFSARDLDGALITGLEPSVTAEIS